MKFNLYFCVYFVLVVTYLYILLQNKNKILENKDTGSILSEKQSILFETIETLSLLIISIILYKQKFFSVAFMFTVPLFVHINQLLFCYRATLDSLQVIIILLFTNSILYSYSVKCYWVMYVFLIGIFLHILSLAYKKPFMKVVCVNKKRRLQSS